MLGLRAPERGPESAERHVLTHTLADASRRHIDDVHSPLNSADRDATRVYYRQVEQLGAWKLGN